MEALPAFAPDKSEFNPSASSNIMNVKPTADGWGPMPAHAAATSSGLASAPRGQISIKDDDGTWHTFVGTATDLYELSSTDYTATELSKSTAAYNLADGESWEFAKFGNYIIATATGSTVPQYYELGVSTLFADLTNASFTAALVWVAGDFLCFGRIGSDGRKVKWSGVNNIFFWTPRKQGSGEQTLPDGGDIQRGLGQTHSALIVQADKIRRMQWNPQSGWVFTFPVLNPNRGAYASRSVVNIGPEDFVFLANDGFYRGSEGIPIGAEIVDRWFFDQVDGDNGPLVHGVADPYDKIVWWQYVNTGGDVRLLGYDWQLKRWFQSNENVTGLVAAATEGYSLDDLDAFGNMETLPYPLDSRFWKGGIPGFAGFNSSNEFGFFDGSNLAATIDTASLQLNYPRRAILDKVKPLVDTNDYTVGVGVKELMGDTFTFGSDLSPFSGEEWITDESSGHYHKFRFKISAGATWSNASGFDVEHHDGGWT